MIGTNKLFLNLNLKKILSLKFNFRFEFETANLPGFQRLKKEREKKRETLSSKITLLSFGFEKPLIVVAFLRMQSQCR